MPRGKAALGYSQSLPRDVPLHTQEQLADMMCATPSRGPGARDARLTGAARRCMALGGRAAEEVVFEEVSSGAQNDLERVTQMAHSQVTVYGMSEAVGPLSFGQQGDSNEMYRPYSEKTAQLIDSEVQTIVSDSYKRSVALLREHKTKLAALAEALLRKEVIGVEDLVEVLGPRPFNKNTDYEEFINAAYVPPEAAAATAASAAPDASSQRDGGSM